MTIDETSARALICDSLIRDSSMNPNWGLCKAITAENFFLRKRHCSGRQLSRVMHGIAKRPPLDNDLRRTTPWHITDVGHG